MRASDAGQVAPRLPRPPSAERAWRFPRLEQVRLDGLEVRRLDVEEHGLGVLRLVQRHRPPLDALSHAAFDVWIKAALHRVRSGLAQDPLWTVDVSSTPDATRWTIEYPAGAAHAAAGVLHQLRAPVSESEFGRAKAVAVKAAPRPGDRLRHEVRRRVFAGTPYWLLPTPSAGYEEATLTRAESVFMCGGSADEFCLVGTRAALGGAVVESAASALPPRTARPGPRAWRPDAQIDDGAANVPSFPALIAVGCRWPSRLAADGAAIDVIETALGDVEGPLHTAFRSKSLAYSVDLRVDRRREAGGLFAQFYAGAAHGEVLVEAMRSLFSNLPVLLDDAEILRLRHRRHQLLPQFFTGLRQLVAYAADLFAMGLPNDFFDTTRDAVAEVAPGAVREVAEAIVDGAELTLAFEPARDGVTVEGGVGPCFE